MDDLKTQLAVLDGLDAPETWEDIRRRTPGKFPPTAGAPGRNRIVVAIFACVIAAVPIWFLVRGFDRGPGPITVPPATAHVIDPAFFEQRQVRTVVLPSDPTYDSLKLTCSGTGEALISCLSDEKSVDVVLVGALGPYPRTKYILGEPIVDASEVLSATPAQEAGSSGWVLRIQLNTQGAGHLETATGDAASAPAPQNEIATIVDGRVVSATSVQAVISSGSEVVPGFSTRGDAVALAARLDNRVAIELDEQGGPTNRTYILLPGTVRVRRPDGTVVLTEQVRMGSRLLLSLPPGAYEVEARVAGIQGWCASGAVQVKGVGQQFLTLTCQIK